MGEAAGEREETNCCCWDMPELTGMEMVDSAVFLLYYAGFGSL